MDAVAECEFESRTDSWSRIDGELGSGNTRALLDNRGSDAPLFQLARREPPFEFETLTVILDDQRARIVGVGQTHEHVAGAAMLADIDQCLLDDARKFERGGGRKGNWSAGPDEPCRDAGVAPEAFDKRRENVGELIAGFELQRPQRLHQLAQRKDFALQQVMNLAELVVDLLGCQRPAAAQRLDFHLDSKQRLNGSVVQLP